ncbi:hypothetical protein [Neobacillus cucumis]|uniref:Uncharacterized protein n=1 Tax=Neobacillus cucumis TaxID=1740721 RepID=A0A2N5H7U8_9BACI|nr:hypothetical protein [Neobacillus cucumis]PLS01570.1 hypothetical protein CVD27_24575 [Neobacillus cucumis]
MTSTKESIPIQLEPFLLSRKNFYQFLYTLFLEPNNEELLFELSQVGDFEELKECHEGGRILAGFFEQMKMKKNFGSEREEFRRLYLGAAMLLEDFLNFDLITLLEVREALKIV